jgi:hypothetical protein
VPEGTTKAQIREKLRASGYDVSQLEDSAEGVPTGRGMLTVAEAIPFIPEETRQQIGQTIRGLRSGAAQALMTPAQVTGAAPVLGLPARGAPTEEYLRQEYGADPTALTGQVGRIGTEILLGMPLVRGVGAAIERVSPALGQSVKTGGFEIPATVEGASGIGLRMAGGGIGGAVGAIPTFNTQDVMMGGPLGAVLAPAVRLLFGAGRIGKDILFTPPSEVAENALLGAAGQEGVNALRATQGMRTTPGYVPSVSERMVEGGVDNIALAALQDRIKRARDAAQIQVDAVQKNMGYLRGQLDRIEQELAQEGTQLAPADLTRLSEVRNNLQRQLAGEEQNLNALMTSLRSELPAKTPYEVGAAPGEVIQSRAEALRRRMRMQEVQPAYAAAFNAAEGAQIDVTPIADAARAALGRPLAEFAPESAPAIARVLAPLQPTPTQGLIVGPGGRPLTTGVELPTMSLEELDALRKAINSDIASAQRSTAGLTPAQVPELYALHRQLDEVIANAPNLSDEAKTLYGKALETYRMRFAPAFKDNVTGRLLKDSAFGETRILPENTVAAYFKDPTDTRQFLTTFGQDPQARASFMRGIQDMFRDAVVDPVTLRVKPDAAASFLQKHADKLQLLEQNGLPIRQQLERVQTESARITQGLNEVASLRGAYGQANPQDVVQSLIEDPKLMNDALRRLTPDGREAIQASVVQRVTNMISGEKPDIGAAVKLLAENSASIKQVMGKGGFADLDELVKRTGQVRKVATEFERALPDARVQPKVQQLIGNFSREELTDLSLVAADIARFSRSEGLASMGSAASRPSAQRLATEAGEEASPIQGYNPLNRVTQLAMRVSRHLEARINDKAANELAVLMYTKPDEALEAMQRALNRKERRTMFSGTAGRFTAATAPRVASPFVTFDQE